MDINQYSDITCWSVYVLDKETQRLLDLGRELNDTILPNCSSANKRIEAIFKDLRSVISESVYNCAEHAYPEFCVGFSKWYLGIGEYPDTNKYSFCVYDMGQGFKASMEANSIWRIVQGSLSTESDWIQRAVSGVSGVEQGKKLGRGQGLKTAVELITNNSGQIEIISGRGYYKSTIHNHNDRQVELVGSMISFYVPFKFI